MATNGPHQWMWGDALDALARAERMHRQIFNPARGQTRQPRWEPPVDVLETDQQVIIIAALPGVSDEALNVVIEGSVLVIAGERTLPVELVSAVIHRLELPQGHFERRVPLPAGTYDQVQRRTINGCLVINLRKAK